MNSKTKMYSIAVVALVMASVFSIDGIEEFFNASEVSSAPLEISLDSGMLSPTSTKVLEDIVYSTSSIEPVQVHTVVSKILDEATEEEPTIKIFKEQSDSRTFHLQNMELHEELRYIEFDEDALRGYLNEYNSILADEPYFSTIIATAKDKGLSPIVLFAITGAEQGFVPRDNRNSKLIANNPFNVFHSWYEYNTDIEDSTEIVIRTLFRLSADCPEGVDIFHWINGTGDTVKYAEDRNWHNNVRLWYNKISEYLEIN